MDVQVGQTQKITISGQGITDPITVYAEDHRPGGGSITICCFSRAWTAGWGGMGKCTMLQFFVDADAHYLLKYLVPSENRTELDIEGTIRQVKRELFEMRRQDAISKEKARELWDLHIGDLKDSLEEWELQAALRKLPWELIEHAQVSKLTSDAEWLRDTIIPTAQTAIRQVLARQTATQAVPA